MHDDDTPPPSAHPPAPPSPPVPPQDALPVVPHVEAKATALLLALLLMVVGAVVYLAYARGAFEPTQTLVLVSDDSEGVGVGMNLTFAGFPIGRVRRIELAPDGNARIVVDVPVKDAHWLRESSVFTLVRGVVGNTNIRAYSGVLTDPPLPDGAVRTVLRGDTAAEVPKLMAAARELLQNLGTLTAADSALGGSLGNVQALTERLNGPGGGLGVLLGSDAEAKKLLLTLERTNQLLARLDGLAAKADAQVFGRDGVMTDARATVQQLNGLLGDARASLKKVDAVLDDAKAISGSAKGASADLGALRAQVEASLRNVDALIVEVNRKWPFRRDTEVRLP
jgi:phospholipid/cholesterol/gamma-HCH transport system substrate-binding protein